MTSKILLITPPLIQLNSPYPASMVLSGHLQSKGFAVRQYDLSIELVNRLLVKEVVASLFEKSMEMRLSKQIRQMQVFQNQYANRVEEVAAFLRNPTEMEADNILSENYLPIGPRRQQVDETKGNAVSKVDRAIWFSTLFIEEIADLIRAVDNSHFELVRYGEKLSVSLPSLQPVIDEIKSASGVVVDVMLELLRLKLVETNPKVVAFTVPFPGNLLAALTCGNYIKTHFPEIQIVMGGGYVNTELRYLQDVRLFDYIDYLVFDDGELPLERLMDKLVNWKEVELIRTWQRVDAQIVKHDPESVLNHRYSEGTAPSYHDIEPKNYLSLIETANPMHSLWSCGFWNKMTLAHGCYWAKCAFCDTLLDYIKRFEPNEATRIVDQMEAVMKQTGENGFHFTDEALPPALIRKVCLEIIQRKLNVRWWGNIRFEKSFNEELCALMHQSGCIAVSGGLEMVSPRLLTLINKGVTMESATEVLNCFKGHHIMVHSYLMYGFPTQTLQETVDALEVVRQLFQADLIQSGFWHRYAMTLYSDSGLNPEKYGAKVAFKGRNKFANNEIPFTSKHDLVNDKLGTCLSKALYNFLYKNGFEIPVNHWFDFSVPKTTVKKTFIRDLICF
jgi:radical SAM superfamily enzyme YgiQ (UPF0313 family)